MVACGIGVALVPASSAEHGIGPHGLVRFVRFRGAATVQLAAVWRAGSTNPAVSAFGESADQTSGDTRHCPPTTSSV
jgi:DNA-binding transcriptional LysR family regulator